MKSTFQELFLSRYFGMHVVGIVYLYYTISAFTLCLIISLLHYVSSPLFLSRTIGEFKNNSLLYVRIKLSSTLIKTGTLSDLFRITIVPNKIPFRIFGKYIAFVFCNSIALKKPFFQIFLVKCHVLEVP